ncbi:MAG: DMT family transporter [Desulfamplus sp.]|nr:DMT family transporter [Desulfamplus sp.]
MDKRVQCLIIIHGAVLLFSMSGLFGKFLDISATLIVFGRTAFATFSLAFVLHILKIPVKYRNRRDLLFFFMMGGILAIHWVTFFHSIQISTVAVGLISFSSFPIFVTFLEPLFFNERLHLRDIAVSMVVFAGLVMVIPDFDISNNLTRGVLWGTVSGLTFALLSILNRKYIAQGYSSLAVAFYQDGVACLLLFPFVGRDILGLTLYDAAMIGILGVVFTALAHTLFIQGMAGVKAALAGVISCLEPVYGTLFAIMFFQEIPSVRMVAGGTVILAGVYYATAKARV